MVSTDDSRLFYTSPIRATRQTLLSRRCTNQSQIDAADDVHSTCSAATATIMSPNDGISQPCMTAEASYSHSNRVCYSATGFSSAAAVKLAWLSICSSQFVASRTTVSSSFLATTRAAPACALARYASESSSSASLAPCTQHHNKHAQDYLPPGNMQQYSGQMEIDSGKHVVRLLDHSGPWKPQVRGYAR